MKAPQLRAIFRSVLKAAGAAMLVAGLWMLVNVGWKHYAFYEYVTRERPANDLSVGHLSGVPVEIPSEFSWFLEYENKLRKPGLFELYPDRAPSEGITSFGFEVEYPSMRPVFGTRDERSIYESMRLRVGVGAGSIYGNPLWLDRGLSGDIYRPIYMYGGAYRYSKIPRRTYGLAGYELLGVPSKFRGPPTMAAVVDRNVYYVTDKEGHVSTLIKCSNVHHAAAPCTQTFSLEPAIKARVSVSYRVGLLPHWREIQQSVSQIVLGFRTHDPATAEVGGPAELKARP